MKFLIDACVASKNLLQLLVVQGHDVLSASKLGPGVGDDVLLQLALNDDRVLITADTDFGKLIFVYGLAHGGIIRFDDMDVADHCRFVCQIISSYQNELQAGAIVTVSRGRIRIRT